MKAASGFHPALGVLLTPIGGCIVISVLVLATGLLSIGIARAATTQDPDWPCIQRMMPSLSVGTMWRGPSLESVKTDWRKNATIKALVEEVSSRRTPLEEARQTIGNFATGLGADKDPLLTTLFSGVFDTINRHREVVIQGVKKYARRQRALGEKITREMVKLEELRNGGTPETDSVLQDLSEKLSWDIRIFEERERSLTAVCAQPVLLEQRLFALAREIMANLE